MLISHPMAVRHTMAANTERNEVAFVVATIHATGHDVVDVKVPAIPTALAAPTVAPEHTGV
jgi:hypothetical protein